MKIYIEGGSFSALAALDKVVDDEVWINGAALKRFVTRAEQSVYRITLIQRKRWWSGVTEQIIKTTDSYGDNDYYSRVVLPKEK